MSRKTTATIKQAESMSQLELAMLLDATELKAVLTKFSLDDNFPESTYDTMLEALALKILKADFSEFCDTL